MIVGRFDVIENTMMCLKCYMASQRYVARSIIVYDILVDEGLKRK